MPAPNAHPKCHRPGRVRNPTPPAVSAPRGAPRPAVLPRPRRQAAGLRLSVVRTAGFNFRLFGRQGLGFRLFGSRGLGFRLFGRRGFNFRLFGRQGLGFRLFGRRGFSFRRNGTRRLASGRDIGCLTLVLGNRAHGAQGRRCKRSRRRVAVLTQEGHVCPHRTPTPNAIDRAGFVTRRRQQFLRLAERPDRRCSRGPGARRRGFGFRLFGSRGFDFRLFGRQRFGFRLFGRRAVARSP